MLGRFIVVLLFLQGIQVVAKPLSRPDFSAPEASENILVFDHIYVTDMTSLEELPINKAGRDAYIEEAIRPLMKFLFGPGTYRSIGSPQRGDAITVNWEAARIEEGRVVLPYHYIGEWILDLEVARSGRFKLPVPLNRDRLFSENWKDCTDGAPEHATESSYWYFWDPSRPGCDHKEGYHYSQVEMLVGVATENQNLSFPEYGRMIRVSDGEKLLSMTIGFGYVKDPLHPNPERDFDAGAYEYRKFVARLRSQIPGFKEEPIFVSEYRRGGSKLVMGHRFTGYRFGVRTVVNVVMSGAVDQMELFAKSFAHDHDGMFAWLGHSRVGSGFDALQFRSLLRQNPRYYSVTDQYQLIYWGGCNSYSYYTLPFFEFKSAVNKERDPHGTKNLDIIAHGLPSLFNFNAANAEIVTAPVLNWPERTSYQKILKALESNSHESGVTLLAAVLGDEDNPR